MKITYRQRDTICNIVAFSGFVSMWSVMQILDHALSGFFLSIALGILFGVIVDFVIIRFVEE